MGYEKASYFNKNTFSNPSYVKSCRCPAWRLLQQLHSYAVECLNEWFNFETCESERMNADSLALRVNKSAKTLF